MVDCPEQIVLLPETDATGGASTFTVVVAVSVQPLAFVTVTVYVVCEVGLSVIVAVVAPVFHK